MFRAPRRPIEPPLHAPSAAHAARARRQARLPLWTRGLVSGAAAVTVVACGDVAPPGPTVVFDTLPSGTVVVENRPGEHLPVWRLVEDLRIGRVDGEGPDLFGDVRSIAVDDRGGIHVLEAQAQEVRGFDRDGVHLYTAGGRGEGPGELTAANGLVFGPDGLLRVIDPRAQRVTFLRPDGSLEGTGPVAFPSAGWIWQGGALDDGRLVDATWRRDDDAFRRYYRVFAPGSGGEDEMLPTPPLPDEPRWDAFEFERGSMGVPFAPMLFSVFGGDATVWTVRGDRYELVHHTLDGDTLRVVRSVTDSVPLPDATRQEAIENVTAFAERVGGSRADVDVSRIPTYYRLVQGLAIDRAGRSWVRLAPHEGAPGALFDVFDSQGRLIARAEGDFTPPPWIPPVVTDDAYYSMITDELDVPWVVRYRIEREPG